VKEDTEGHPDFVRITDLPPSTLFLLALILPAAAAAFFGVFHLFAALAGWPGPFLWFGSGNRWQDIFDLLATIVISGTLMMVIGVCVLKLLARHIRILDLRLRVRRR
jgi:hypothetical protein